MTGDDNEVNDAQALARFVAQRLVSCRPSACDDGRGSAHSAPHTRDWIEHAPSGWGKRPSASIRWAISAPATRNVEERRCPLRRPANHWSRFAPVGNAAVPCFCAASRPVPSAGVSPAAHHDRNDRAEEQDEEVRQRGAPGSARVMRDGEAPLSSFLCASTPAGGFFSTAFPPQTVRRRGAEPVRNSPCTTRAAARPPGAYPKAAGKGKQQRRLNRRGCA
jgi:hypothetical protein